LKRWIGGIAVTVVLAVIVIASIVSGGPRGEKVYVEPVKRRNIEEVVSAPGEIDPKVKVSISAHVIGKIEKLYFNEGDLVRKGQRLVDLERVAFTAQRDRAGSELVNRRIDAARAKNNLANARVELDRAVRLRREGIQTQELFDRARLDYDNAKAALDSAAESIHQADATLAQASDDLARTTILSPIDGRVVQLNAHEGEVVVTGTMNNPGSVIAVIADLSEILVQADVAETEVVKVQTGQRSRVKVDAVPDKEYEARIVEIGSSANTRQGSGSGLRYFTVKAALENGDGRLRPGMTSEVDIITSSAPNIVAVPVQSVVERNPTPVSGNAADSGDETGQAPKHKYVFVVRDDKAHMVEVETGISNATHVAIISGLKGNEKVVTGPFKTLKALKDNAPVQPQKEPDQGQASDEPSKES
jgi:HlyD family secretion protein